ncbi:dUTP diphosphatase [Agaribacter marinus]|uniref:dUTPase n=1 Tax=Agaribacter marinus TaxID=1431249 RepID=A0AA37SYA7_9ALTE|nr:dUTP diphosphatase [Agaribacter marinus]GLR72118.1 dUTPase [Agaribacter marinus]
MLSSAQLSTMLNLQDEMNKKVNPAWLTANYGYLRAAMIESVEGMDHHGWKWWKHQEKDLAQLQMELVDIWHFALSAIIIEFNGDIDKSAQVIAGKLESGATKVHFDGAEYDYSSAELLDNLQLMTGLCAANRFDVPLFMVIVVQAEMDSEELFKQYVGKNILNFFRQDHGYKDGSYIKVWHGREDNEHLVDVLASTDVNASGYSQLIYTGLKSRYPK